MNFRIQNTLACRGPNEQAADQEVEETLLVGDVVAGFETGHNSLGHDNTIIRPAFYAGNRAWLRSDNWCPADGYSASGFAETILTFEEGVELLCKYGAFDAIFTRD